MHIFPQYLEKDMISPEPEKIIKRKVKALLSKMTDEEIMNLCHGGYNPEGMQVANAGYNGGVPRLGVPEIRMYDGPAGVTSIHETTGLPVHEVLASTWSTQLAYQFGKVAGSENFVISGNTQLGSQYDVVRTPHYRRNKDMMGEDPFLTSRLAIEETKGIQDQHVSATIKHFALANMDESPEGIPDQIIDEQSLHELYFLPFEAAIKEAHATSIMCSYNKFNGAFASANIYAQKVVLRDMWKFQGFMMSDWGANHELTVGKGMDMEMPFGAYNGNDRIQKGIERGRISWKDVKTAASHVLYSLGMLGYLCLVELDENGEALEEPGRIEPIKLKDRYNEAVTEGLLEENASICRKLAEKGCVLLKNDGALPLVPADYTRGHSVAMLGLGAVALCAGTGQERAYGRISRMKPPGEELKKLAGENANIETEIGLAFFGETIPTCCLFADKLATVPGLVRSYGIDPSNKLPNAFAGPAAKNDDNPPQKTGGAGLEFKGVATADGEDLDEPIPFSIPWKNDLAGEMAGHKLGEFCCYDSVINFTTGTKNYRNSTTGTAFPQGSSFTWDGFIKVPEDGEYTLLLHCIGGTSVFYIQQEGIFIPIASSSMRENSQWPWGSIVSTPEGMEVLGGTIQLKANILYPIRLCAKANVKFKDLQLRLAWITPHHKKNCYEKALTAAKKADKVVFFLTDDYHFSPVGTHKSFWLSDLPSLLPPKHQISFLTDVKKVMKPDAKLIVVHNSGQPYAMGQIEKLANAILNVWTPGQEGGGVIADLLMGNINPSGKMPISVPAEDKDTLLTDTQEHRVTRHLGVKKSGQFLVYFDEGIFTGYRWYDKAGIKPLYAFGHGLSYTTFKYDHLHVAGRTVNFSVTNTGAVTGSEIAQVYLGPGNVPDKIQMVQKQLCAFVRLEDIVPGETRHVTVTIPDRSFMYWDPHKELETYPDGSKGKWVSTQGPRKIMIGGASDNLPLVGKIE